VADLWLAPPPPVEEEPPERVATARKGSAPKEPEFLTMEGARKVVKKNGGQVKYCYEKALEETPGLSGRLEVRMTIAETGRVSEAKVTSSNLPPAVDTCVVAKVKRWEFTRPVGDMVLEYPFVFSPG
jgi:TonB family protein